MSIIKELPTDLWCRIWEFLDDRSLVQATKTCLFFKNNSSTFAQQQFDKIKAAYQIIKTMPTVNIKQIVKESFSIDENLSEMALLRKIRKTIFAALETTRSLFPENSFALINNNETIYHAYLGYPLELQKLQQAFEESKFGGGPYTLLDFLFRFRFQDHLDETWKVTDPFRLWQEIQNLVDISLKLFEKLFNKRCTSILKSTTQKSEYHRFFKCLASTQTSCSFAKKLHLRASKEIYRVERPNLMKISTIYRICPVVGQILLKPSITNGWYSILRLLLTSQQIVKYELKEEMAEAMRASRVPAIRELGAKRDLLKNTQLRLSCTPQEFWKSISTDLADSFIFRPNIPYYFHIGNSLNEAGQPKSFAFCCQEVLRKSRTSLNLLENLFPDLNLENLNSSNEILPKRFFKCLHFLMMQHYEIFEKKINFTFDYRYIQSDLGLDEDPRLETLEAYFLTRAIPFIKVHQLSIKAIERGNELLFDYIFKSRSLTLERIFSLLPYMENSPSKYIRDASKRFFHKKIKEIFELRGGDTWEIFIHVLEHEYDDVLHFLVKNEADSVLLQRYFLHLQTLRTSAKNQRLANTMMNALSFHIMAPDIAGYIKMYCPNWSAFADSLELL